MYLRWFTLVKGTMIVGKDRKFRDFVTSEQDIQCPKCGKALKSGDTIYLPEDTNEVWCSVDCLGKGVYHSSMKEKRWKPRFLRSPEVTAWRCILEIEKEEGEQNGKKAE